MLLPIHKSHKKRIKEMFMEGFTTHEIAIAYKTDKWRIDSVVQGMTPPERI